MEKNGQTGKVAKKHFSAAFRPNPGHHFAAKYRFRNFAERNGRLKLAAAGETAADLIKLAMIAN